MFWVNCAHRFQSCWFHANSALVLSCQSELVLLNVGASANLSYHSTAPVDQVVRRAHSIYISKKAALSSSSFSISTSTPQLVVGIVVTRRHDRARPLLRIFNNVFSPFLFVLDACVKISKDFMIWMMIGPLWRTCSRCKSFACWRDWWDCAWPQELLETFGFS